MIADVIIVGAGSAGLAAALQLRRYGLEVCLFEGARPGGLLWNANCVENYPGFPGGIGGPELVQTILEQADRGGVSIIPGQVLSLAWEGGLFQAVTSKQSYLGRAAVVASGTRPRPLSGFDIPLSLQDRVTYEVAGLRAISDRRFLIVGGGDAAFDYALTLAQRNFVIILNRNDQVLCLPLLWERVQAFNNIEYHPGTCIRKLEARPQGGMNVECSSPGGSLALEADYLVGAIGREPALEIVSASLLAQASELENRGILHYIGDVRNGIYRQTAIAVGDGIRAGMRIAFALSPGGQYPPLALKEEDPDESDCLDR